MALLSIAHLDSSELPTISIPIALANEATIRLFDIDRFRRIINRRRRWSRLCYQGASDRCSANQPAHNASAI